MEEQMQRLLQLFADNHVEYQLYEHEPVYTSEQAAKTRGVELKTGVKALLLKADSQIVGTENRKKSHFLLADIAADRKVDFKKLERVAGARKLTFATKEEVIATTGCEPGSVHPLGRLFSLDTYLDESVLHNDFVNFNIGELTRSVRISKDDLLKVMQPKTIGNFSRL